MVAVSLKKKDFWSSLDGQLKPGFELMVRFRVPLDPSLDLGPPIEGVEISVAPKPQAAVEPPAAVDDVAEVATASGRTVGMQRRRRGQVITTQAVEQPGDRRKG